MAKKIKKEAAGLEDVAMKVEEPSQEEAPKKQKKDKKVKKQSVPLDEVAMKVEEPNQEEANKKQKKDKKVKKQSTPLDEVAMKVEEPKKQDEPKKQTGGKKKKNAPDRPQPAWLFPPDDENPILNGKKKSDEQMKKEIEERLAAIDFLKKKAVNAPNRPQPPALLLQLVGAFLGEYSFNYTSRVFNEERKSRVKVIGWEDDIGAKFSKSQPSLTKIFRDWRAEFTMADDETSSSSEGESEDSGAENAVGKEEDSSSSSDDSDDSDDSDKPKSKKAAAQPKPKVDKKDTKGDAKATVNGKKKRASSSSSSSSSSDSDADDETEKAAPATTTTKPTVNGLLEKLKSRQLPQDTPAKPIAEKKDASKGSSSESDSSSDSSSESDSEGGVPTKPRENSDSSNTLTASPIKKKVASSSSSDSSSDSSSSDKAETTTPVVVTTTTTTTKRKRSKDPEDATTVVATKVSKKTNTPFQRVPTDTKIDPKFASNKYQSYDYAQRAHEDLIVTKGKGFTKEKNKKKRGSYRGGQIDVSGGKGIKFDD